MVDLYVDEDVCGFFVGDLVVEFGDVVIVD